MANDKDGKDEYIPPCYIRTCFGTKVLSSSHVQCLQLSFTFYINKIRILISIFKKNRLKKASERSETRPNINKIGFISYEIIHSSNCSEHKFKVFYSFHRPFLLGQPPCLLVSKTFCSWKGLGKYFC